MSEPLEILRLLLRAARDVRYSDELLGNMLRANLDEIEEVTKPALKPGIDTPGPEAMARWLDERAAINIRYAKLPPQQWEASTLPYIGLRLKQAAAMIRKLEKKLRNATTQ